MVEIDNLSKIIQGGMGIGVSGWRLAREVSMCGQLGVVAGTSLDLVLTRKLQDGDLDGNVRRALDAFPFKGMAKRVLDSYFIEGGKPADKPYKPIVMATIDGPRIARENTLISNFVEVYLAKEGHDGIVGVNYLEKVTLPMLPAIYGAMLAKVDYVIIGAGIPREIPAVLDAFIEHRPAVYPIRVTKGKGAEKVYMQFDPADYIEGNGIKPLKRPVFLPIISSATLAKMLLNKSNGKINGFVVEGQSAGGHNAPPRGSMKLTSDGEPIYGDRDVADLEAIKALGLPFWLAGSYGSEDGLKTALDSGAAGIQVGTAFAFCKESGLTEELKAVSVKKVLEGGLKILTSGIVSPTGFPFKVAKLEGTLADEDVYHRRKRVCDLGYLREPYIKDDGSRGYRCCAEMVEAFVKKGGNSSDTIGKVCICNALAANIGFAQINSDGEKEPAFITCGNDVVNLKQFMQYGEQSYSASDVINKILKND